MPPKLGINLGYWGIGPQGDEAAEIVQLAEASGFELKMETLRPERRQRLDVEILQDVQHHQGGEPLPVRR